MIHIRLRARGGNLAHLVPEGSQVAICGFRPSGHPTEMRPRHGWALPRDFSTTCRGCAKRASRAKKEGRSLTIATSAHRFRRPR